MACHIAWMAAKVFVARGAGPSLNDLSSEFFLFNSFARVSNLSDNY